MFHRDPCAQATRELLGVLLVLSFQHVRLGQDGHGHPAIREEREGGELVKSLPDNCSLSLLSLRLFLEDHDTQVGPYRPEHQSVREVQEDHEVPMNTILGNRNVKAFHGTTFSVHVCAPQVKNEGVLY